MPAVTAGIGLGAVADLTLGHLAADVVLRAVGLQRDLWMVEHHQQLGLVGVQPLEQAIKGLDIRYVVTNMVGGSAEWLYETMYCARGQMENFIELHKTQLHSDRTSCRSPLANQVRLVLHTAAYWLFLKVRDNIPKLQPLAIAEFKTIQMRLIKIGARIAETAKRVRIAFAAGCPDADLFSGLARCFQPAGP